MDYLEKVRQFGYEGNFEAACMNGSYIDLKFGNILANMGFDHRTQEGRNLAALVIFNDNKFNMVGADEAAGDYLRSVIEELEMYREFCANYRNEDMSEHDIRRIDEEAVILDEVIGVLKGNLTDSLR